MHSELLSPVLAASGLMNFFGEGYWYHRWYQLLTMGAFSFEGMRLVTKTTTLNPRKGNMPLQEDGVTPQERKPKCIWASTPFIGKGLTLNAVGLSGPGLETLLDAGVWQSWTTPFWISFMSVAPSESVRYHEVNDFVMMMRRRKDEFQAPFGIQYNGSCPNQKGVSTEEAVAESFAHLDLLAELEVPVMYKLSVTTTPEQAKPMTEHPVLSALCVSNTVPFGKLPDRIDWHALFGVDRSEEIGPIHSPIFKDVGMSGGLSGPPLFPILVDWVRQARQIGINTHINAGGGIFSRQDVRTIKSVGANSISLGSVAIHRPWRVRGMIQEAQKQFS